MHLLLAPFGAGVVLVEAGEVAIVALVERLVADRLEVALADRVEDVLAGDLRPRQRRGEGDVELDAALGELAAGALGFLVPCSVRPTSRQPVNRFFRFHSLWPWRTRTRVPDIDRSCVLSIG